MSSSAWYEDEDAELEVKGPPSIDHDAEDPRHPARFVLHPSSYARHLYDVTGALLVNEKKRLLTVWDAGLRDELQSGKLRCIHVPGRPGYRYFVRSKDQAADFQYARDTGLASGACTFHIYPDEPGLVLPYEQVNRRRWKERRW